MKHLYNLIILTTIIILTTTSSLLAETCVQLKKDSIEVKWTAFKTPAKIGVSGKLKSVTLTGPSKGQSIQEILEKSSFSIATDKSSIDSKNPSRDAKIAKAFFSTLKKNGQITGRVSKFLAKKKNQFIISLNLNGVTKKLPLTFKVNQLNLSAEGFIDVLDYSMAAQLAALNKACFAKHEGKTWSDVEVKLYAQFENCSK